MRYFFFTQKSAYEMRMSDWSSDVCSSDLGPVDFESPEGRLRSGLFGTRARTTRLPPATVSARLPVTVPVQNDPMTIGKIEAADDHLRRMVGSKQVLGLAELVWNAVDAHAPQVEVVGKIGKAWCRARVCQDGSFPLVATAQKKK